MLQRQVWEDHKNLEPEELLLKIEGDLRQSFDYMDWHARQLFTPEATLIKEYRSMLFRLTILQCGLEPCMEDEERNPVECPVIETCPPALVAEATQESIHVATKVSYLHTHLHT